MDLEKSGVDLLGGVQNFENVHQLFGDLCPITPVCWFLPCFGVQEFNRCLHQCNSCLHDSGGYDVLRKDFFDCLN
jgi:hypothetical protein